MTGYSFFKGHRCKSYWFFIFCVSLLFLLWGCGGDSSGQAATSSDTGLASFAIQWHTASSAQKASMVVKQAIESCSEAGVESITCAVYDESDNRIAGGGPWNCSDHHGTLNLIPVGSNRTFAVLGWSGAEGTGNIVYQGQLAGITINPTEIANVGTIDAYPFVPQLSGPADGENVDINAFALAWNSVANAARYRVLVSDDSSFATPLIDTQPTGPTYRPLDLAPLTTYYWRVAALDNHGNEGAASATRQFTTTEVYNQVPTAAITAPATGASFPLVQTIAFQGSGEDAEDGDLSGNSLVWSSDIDDQIGTGASFETQSLSAGTHTITLTATDSNGATGVATVDITIVAPNQAPTATISAPADNSTFTQGELVSFSGSGNDPEDGALSGNSLVWSSSIDGRIGTGTSFGTQSLSGGNHTITLTVTDSDGATDSDTIGIEITNIIDVNIDFDFEYIAEGFPMELASGETAAADLADAPVESLEEPDYGRFHFQRYSYFTMGNSQDTVVSFVLNTNYENFFEFYVDSNNNEDLTDDGGPIANQGQGVLFAAPVSLSIDIVSGSASISRPYKLWMWLDSNYNVKFYALCHYTGQLVIDGQSYTAVAFEDRNHDVLYKENGLYIDLNGDETLDAETENFLDGAQLSINGTNYLLQLNYP